MALSESRRPNELMGNEPDLIARFGVSRSVFREAIRIVEFDGLAVMKLGSFGGLLATEPDGDAVTHALSVYLRHRNTGVEDLYEARLTTEPQCASLAAMCLRMRTHTRAGYVYNASHSSDRKGIGLCSLQ